MASLDDEAGPPRPRPPCAALAVLALGVLGCVTRPAAPALADVLGRQRSVPLGVCALNELSAGVTEVQCDALYWAGFLPIVGFAALSFWFSAAFLRASSGHRKRTADLAVGVLAAIPGIFLCYFGYQSLHAHRFVFERARQTVTHEARVLGRLVASDVYPVRDARCTHYYSSGGKNRSAGWGITLHTEGAHEHTIGRLRAEPDAQAVCRYLLPPAAEATPR